MMFAHVTDGTVDQVGQPPALLFNGSRWWDLRTLDPTVLAGVGWFPVTETPRPDDTAQGTHTLSYTVDGSTVTQTWTPRDWTEQEREQQAQITDLQARVEALEAYVFQVSPVPTDAVPWTETDWPPGAVVTHLGDTWKNNTTSWLNALCVPGDPLHPFWSPQGGTAVPWAVGMHLIPDMLVSNLGHVYQYKGVDTASAPANWEPTGTVSTATWLVIS